MGKHIKKDRKRRGEAEATWVRRQKIKSVRKDGRRRRNNQYQLEKRMIKELGVQILVQNKTSVLRGLGNGKGGNVELGKGWGKVSIYIKGIEGERRGNTTRIQNRCVETGYSRSVQRWFRRSGRRRREKARRGELSAVTSRSW